MTSININNNEIAKDYVLICDNWSIQKTSKVENFLNKHSIHLLTIPPYSPWLNAVEIMINRIKMSINKQRRLWK